MFHDNIQRRSSKIQESQMYPIPVAFLSRHRMILAVQRGEKPAPAHDGLLQPGQWDPAQWSWTMPAENQRWDNQSCSSDEINFLTPILINILKQEAVAIPF